MSVFTKKNKRLRVDLKQDKKFNYEENQTKIG